MSGKGFKRHSTDRKNITWIGSCSGCDLEFEVEAGDVTEDGDDALSGFLQDYAESHESECDGNVGWIRKDEQSEVLTDGGIDQARFPRRSVIAFLPFLTAGCLSELIGDDTIEKLEGVDEMDFADELRDRGFDVDSVMTMANDVSVMFYRDDVSEQIEDLAEAFVPYRGIVEVALAFTILEDVDERHGAGAIGREVVDAYAEGEIDFESYVSQVKETYYEF